MASPQRKVMSALRRTIARGLVPFYILLGIGTAGVFYLSWLPNPHLALVGLFPNWLGDWVDDQQNENMRTAVPLGLLGILAGYWLASSHRGWLNWLITWVALVGVVLLAELGQLRLPDRHFDWGDIGWGAVGALVGLGLIPLAINCYQKVKRLTA